MHLKQVCGYKKWCRYPGMPCVIEMESFHAGMKPLVRSVSESESIGCQGAVFVQITKIARAKKAFAIPYCTGRQKI